MSDLQISERPCLEEQSRWHLKSFPGFDMHVHICAQAEMTTCTHTHAELIGHIGALHVCESLPKLCWLFYLMTSKLKHKDVVT